MIKKTIGFILSFSLLFIANTFFIQAYDVNKVSEDIDLQAVYDSIPKEVTNDLPSDILLDKDITKTTDSLSSDTLKDYCLNVIQRLLGPTVKSFSSTFALIIIISLINTVKNSFSNDYYSKTITYVTTVILAVAVYETVNNTSTYLSAFFKNIDALINALIPITTALYSMGGNVSTAVINSAGFSFTITLLNFFLQHLMLPFSKMIFVLSFACMLSNINGIGKLGKTLKTILSSILVGTTTLFSVYLLFKTNLSTAADGVAARTIKFAGSFIPIIGSPLGESIRTIMSGVTLIKSSVGFIGIFILLIITLPPLIKLLLNKFSFDILSGISFLLGNEKEGDFLKEVSSLYSFLLAITLSVCILFLFELTIFSFISPALGGN